MNGHVPQSLTWSEEAWVAHGVGAELVVTLRVGGVFLESWNGSAKKAPLPLCRQGAQGSKRQTPVPLHFPYE